MEAASDFAKATHDLRGEYASRLHEAGVPIERIARLLDHSTLLMTQRYVKVRTESLVDAIEKLEAFNARLTLPPKVAKGGATTDRAEVV